MGESKVRNDRAKAIIEATFSFASFVVGQLVCQKCQMALSNETPTICPECGPVKRFFGFTEEKESRLAT